MLRQHGGKTRESLPVIKGLGTRIKHKKAQNIVVVVCSRGRALYNAAVKCIIPLFMLFMLHLAWHIDAYGVLVLVALQLWQLCCCVVFLIFLCGAPS